MPELPEVETTRRGIATALTGQTLTGAIVRNPRLRWPVPPDLDDIVAGRPVLSVARRAKYLLLDLGSGHLILHLGMSGSLRVVAAAEPVRKHDHIDLCFGDSTAAQALRFHDPRRFGALLWQPGDASLHPLLQALGPEPLEAGFNAAYLQTAFASRRLPVKQAIMDNHVVVGVGNIYASESLFRAGIHPLRRAANVGPDECARLVETIRQTLLAAIEAGGSTLRDYVGAAGVPGYFQQQYFVYGRAQLPCHQCGMPICVQRIGQRSTFWCPHCQPG